jgi:diguanylate cyclase (GGDEF)-like protein
LTSSFQDAEQIGQMTMLVVDDLPGNRMLLKHILEASGFKNVLLAESAQEAFSVLGMNGEAKTTEVDLVLMDVMMPGIDGIEACRRVKAAPEYAETPVIMITALNEVETLEDAFQAGAVDYITKPINQVELQVRVHAALALKYAMDERRRREAELERRERELLELARLLEETNERLRHLSTLDGLTGITNRRRVMEVLDQEWRRSARDRSWLSLVMIDVDYFKAYNDTCGHQAGDDTLWMVANSLKRGLQRPADTVGRYGGEEFVVVLPETPLEGAIKVVEMLRRGIEELRIPHPASQASSFVTISLGVASYIAGKDLAVPSLVSAADRALYQAKAAGRNKMVAAEAREGVPGQIEETAEPPVRLKAASE